MRLDAFLLADAAEASKDGRLFVHGGGITRINARSMPWLEGQLAIVARFIVEQGELDEPHRLTVSLLDPDGEFVVAPAPMVVPKQDQQPNLLDGEESFLQLAITFGPIPFPKPGIYRLELGLDGEVARTMRLPVDVLDQLF